MLKDFLMTECSVANSEAPGDDVIAHTAEDLNPVIGNRYALIHRVEIKQADAKAGRKSREGHAG